MSILFVIIRLESGREGGREVGREGGRRRKAGGRGKRKRGSAYTSNSKSGSTMRFKTLCTNIKSGNLLNAHVPHK